MCTCSCDRCLRQRQYSVKGTSAASTNFAVAWVPDSMNVAVAGLVLGSPPDCQKAHGSRPPRPDLQVTGGVCCTVEAAGECIWCLCVEPGAGRPASKSPQQARVAPPWSGGRSDALPLCRTRQKRCKRPPHRASPALQAALPHAHTGACAPMPLLELAAAADAEAAPQPVPAPCEEVELMSASAVCRTFLPCGLRLCCSQCLCSWVCAVCLTGNVCVIWPPPPRGAEAVWCDVGFGFFLVCIARATSRCRWPTCRTAQRL